MLNMFGYAAIRGNPDGSESFDWFSFSENPFDAETKSRFNSLVQPAWANDHPVLRVVRIHIQEQ